MRQASRRMAGATVLSTVAVVLAGCLSAEPLTLPAAPSPSVAPLPFGATPAQPSVGRIRVAYPAVPAGFVDPTGLDVAAEDLAALWGLPLYRLDAEGQLRAALVETAATAGRSDGWEVRLTLRAGEWSDGEPVTARDVVATIEALSGRRAELAAIEDARADGDRHVVLRFGRPHARWPYLLGTVGVLPAHVLADGGLEAYEEAVPVSGGPFRLTGWEPGLSASFAPHPDSPLGAPASAELTVLFTPSYETALGLLERGDADAALGHLSLNPVGRAEQVDGVSAAAPLGGTWVGLAWRPDGPYGTDDAATARRALGASVAIDELVEGLLDEQGEAATSPIPGVDGPWTVEGGGDASAVTGVSLLVPGWHESMGFTARLVLGQIEAGGGQLSLRREDSPAFWAAAREDPALTLREFRVPPRPALTALGRDPGTAALRRADEVANTALPGVDEGLRALHEDALVRPLYRIGVAHVWSHRVSGIDPSAWPGLAFGGAAGWQVDEDS